jgi:hypothetical protein
VVRDPKDHQGVQHPEQKQVMKCPIKAQKADRCQQCLPLAKENTGFSEIQWKIPDAIFPGRNQQTALQCGRRTLPLQPEL